MSEPITSVNNINDVILNSLYTKRTEFAHENEVRIIRMNESESKAFKSLTVRFDSQQFFEEIVIDSRVDNEVFLERQKMLIDVNVSPAIIKQSQLYKLNTYRIFV